MGGFIVLEDGRACAPSNRGTDLMLERIAVHVRNDPFRAWLLDQRSTIVGQGLTRVDLRELTPDNRREFRRATRRAYMRVSADDAQPGDDRHESFVEYFAALVEMMDRVDRGEPPAQFNPHMRGLIPETGQRRGPGWS